MGTGIKVQFWLESDGELILGRGRRELLRLMVELGSLRRAAQQLGMSYRAAWGKIRETEKLLGWRLVESTGRSRRLTLTPQGAQLLERFERFEEEATGEVQRVFRKHFQAK
jgi:molybdate transport system regulatory protein